MKSIIKWWQMQLVKALPEWDLSPLTGKERGKLRLSPEQLLQVIHAEALSEWALTMAYRFSRPRLKKRAGASHTYRDSNMLLMAIVQSVWRKSYYSLTAHLGRRSGRSALQAPKFVPPSLYGLGLRMTHNSQTLSD